MDTVFANTTVSVTELKRNYASHLQNYRLENAQVNIDSQKAIF